MPAEDMGSPRSEALGGLTSKEAKRRLERFGPNKLPEKPPPSDFYIFASQLKSPLVYVLVVAGAITLFLRESSDAVIIFFAVFINTILGFLQERKAGRALYALKELVHPKARVIRDGKLRQINLEAIVPGDVVVLYQGDKIPADGKLIEASRLSVSEAILTGESVPVKKNSGGEVYMGTIVSFGQGRFLVQETGAKTQIGKIAEQIQEPVEDTPLKRQLGTFSRRLSLLVLGLTGFVFVVGLLTGKEIVDIFTTAVALAVSAIPEGLLVALTVVLAIGMQRILKRRGLVRNLVSAETLGGVTTICVDKTGTLTHGKLKVVEVLGDRQEVAKQVFLTSDDPVMEQALEWAKEKIGIEIGHLKRKHVRLDSIPFAPQNRFFASLNKGGGDTPAGGNLILVNGAPELLLEWSNMEDNQKIKLQKEIRELTGEGKRVIGMAKKEAPVSVRKLSKKHIVEDLSWVGLLVFSDPVRAGVREALAQTRNAGINIMVITGDYAQTAVFVMKELGMEVKKENIVLGENLEKLTVSEVAEKLKQRKSGQKDSIMLFARTRPQQKLKIIEALKINGETVAMMGDGVNDAPALRRADIGIVVGDATDVAKEAADLVLLDSSFETIVAAIEEGRGIFDNIRKIILYLMSDAFAEIVAVIGSILLGLPLPVTAAQILWINLVSDGFPHLALTVDPKRPGLMKRPPRDPSEPLVASWVRSLILIVSVSGGLMALALFVYFYKTTGDLLLARSIAFATLGMNSLVYVFSVRTLREPFWVENPLANPWLNVAVVGGLALQLTPFIFEKARGFFGTVELSALHWLYVFTAALVMFILIEAAKVVFRKRLAKDLEIS